MSNSQTIPAQRVLNGSKPVKHAFKRALQMQTQIAEAMQLIGMFRDNALAGIGPYSSARKSNGASHRSRNTTAQVKRASIKAANQARHKRRAT